MRKILPSHWNVMKFSEVAEVITGTTPSTKHPEYYGGKIPFVTPSDLDATLPITRASVTLSELGGSQARLLPFDAIMVCCIGSLGKVGFAGTQLTTNQQINSLIFDHAIAFPRYAYHYCRTLKPLLEHLAPSTTVPIVNKSRFKELPIPLAPLPEQRRIAATLDKADAIRRKRQEAIRLTDEFLRSAFLDMFGDSVTNPKGWPVRKLGQLLNFLTSGSRGWAKYYSQQGSIFLRIQNVGRNQLLMNEMTYVNPPGSAEARRTRVQEDDVLLSITADLGRTAVVPPGLGPAYINQHLAILRVNGVEPIYLSAFLAGAGGQRQFKVMNREGVKAGLNFDNIQSVKVIVPPKHLQLRFVELYHKQRKVLGTLSTIVEEDTRLFNSLVQRAFRGEL